MSLASDEKETPTNSEKEPRSTSSREVAAASQSKPPDKRASIAIRLIREDFGLFKQDILKLFKDKDPKPTEVKDKTALNVLKEDLDLFKSELTNFTDDISGILRKGLRKDDHLQTRAKEQKEQRGQEAETEDGCQIKANEREERTEKNEKENSEDREKTVELKVNQQEEQSEDVEKEESVGTEAQEPNENSESAEDSSKINDAEAETKSANVEKDDSIDIKALSVNGDEDKDFELKIQNCSKDTEKGENNEELWVDGWEMVEFEENGRTSKGNVNEKETETGADVTLAQDSDLIALSSGVSLLRLRNVTQNQQRGEFTEDVWAIKNFAQYLTLDPNTANLELVLSDGNRTARRKWGSGHVTHQLSDHMTEHPERFEHCPQVLCREGLLDTVYWEVQWTGGADVGVAYNSLSRQGPVAEGLLGQSESSWSLECSPDSYTPCHSRRRYKSVCPEPFSKTVGVFLDFAAGSLSFFCVSPGSMQHLHTFSATFRQPLYPGFWLWSWGGSVSLSQVELGWERLLQ